MEPVKEIVVPGTIESTATIREFVKDVIAYAGIDRKRGYRLQLAVDEVATNIVVYGYQGSGRSGDILATWEVHGDELRITLEDSAIPFDPHAHPPPDNLEAPLEDRPFGGYGVALAIKNVDRLDYAFVDGHNCNTFIVKLSVQDAV